MQLNEVVSILEKFDLSTEESRVYVFLLQKKSATVREMHASPLFKNKKRPNLYKLLNRLEEKGFLIHETKQNTQRFFPVEPEFILHQKVEDQLKAIQILQVQLPEIEVELNRFREQKNLNFYQIADPILSYTSIVPTKWTLKEVPEIRKEPGLGIIYSVEYDTGRKMGGDTAGITVYKFQYQEHAAESVSKAIEYEQAQFEDALDNTFSQLPLQIKNYEFIQSNLIIKDKLEIPIIKLDIFVKIFGKFTGGFFPFQIQNQETHILCLWGANIKDLKIMVENLFELYGHRIRYLLIP